MANLLYLGNDMNKAPKMHPTYISYRHINPLLHAMKKHMTDDDISEVVHGYRRSEFSEEALIADYKKGDVQRHPIIKDSHYYKALAATKRLFQPPETYRPVSFPDLRYYPWTISTSAEAPYSTSPYWQAYCKIQKRMGLTENDRVTFNNLYNVIFRDNRERIHRIKHGIYQDRHGNDLFYWNQAHARSHLVKSDAEDKIRMVFGVPKLLLSVECMFLWPLMVHLVETDGPMLWGYETLKGGWYSMYQFMHKGQHPATYLALDWKAFDKNAQYSVIDDLHEMMRSYITFENGYIPTKYYPESYTAPDRLQRLWDWMCNAIKHTPDVLPNGDMFQRQHAGIASGFFQTQLLDSMYNCLMLLTILSKMGINIDKIKIKVQGDDSIIGLMEYIAPQQHESFMEMFALEAKLYFGATLNTKKSKMSNDLNGLPLLGYTNNHGIPFRPRLELLANLLYPEKKSDENRLMARCIGIAFAACGQHPTLYKICEDVYFYLESLGYAPSKSGLPDLIRMLIEWESIFMIDGKLQFPSFYATMARLTDVPHRTERQSNRLWSSDLFLQKY